MNELAGVGEPAVTGTAPTLGDPVRPPQGVPVCTFCGEEVNPHSRLTYTRVIGWHRPGKAGGSDITDRKLLDEYAHPQCLDRERWGIHASQEQLV